MIIFIETYEYNDWVEDDITMRLNKKGRKRILFLVDACLLVILIFAVCKLIGYAISYRQSAAQYEAIQQLALITPSPSPIPTPAPTVNGFKSNETPAPTATPEVDFAVDWDGLKNENKDIVAWLYCEGTLINYPVTQRDDNEYYLTRNAYKKKDEAGALFFDCRNNLFSSFENLIIYGHRMNDLSMFGSLARYAKEGYYQSHPVMYLFTPDQTYRMEIFACRTVDAETYYFQTQFTDYDSRQSYINRAINRSYWKPGLPADANYRDYAILTLSTCSRYDGADSPRLLVHGRLVPIP